MPLEPSLTAANASTPGTIPVWSRTIGSWRISIGRQPFAANELAGLYDKAAQTWSTTISKLGFDDAYADLMAMVRPDIPAQTGSNRLNVLDAGIGTGAMSTAFASQWSHPFDLVGMDISPEMLRHARTTLRRKGLQARLMQGDLNHVPFPDNTFDVILVAHVLEHLADPERALAELVRVLKPGGVLIASVTRRSSAGAYIQLKWRTHRIDPDTALAWFHRCGLQRARAVSLTRNTPARHFSTGYVGIKPDP